MMRFRTHLRDFLRARVPVALPLLLLLSVLPGVAMAQGTTRCDDDERVRAVSFSGSPAFDDMTLAASILTHEPGILKRLLGIGTAPCLDSLEMRRDALRIAVLHRQAGWFRASVTPDLQQRKDGVRVRFVVIPGPEAKIDTVDVSGLPEAPPGRRPYGQSLLALQGNRFDRTAVDATVIAVLGRLREVGFARAQTPVTKVTIDSATAKVSLGFAFETGSRLRVGEVKVNVQPRKEGDRQRIDSSEVARLVAIDPGDRYSTSEIVDAQRALYRSEAFRLVLLDTLPMQGPGADTLIGLKVSVAEAQTRSARAGVGWATLDCMRVQGRLVDRGFLGVGRRVELTARASKIGVGDPAGFAPSLCAPATRKDPFSEKLNYYLGTSISNSRLFGLPVAPTASVYSERRSEPFAYLRETTIGAMTEVSRQFSPRLVGSAGVQYENGKTTTDPITSCTRFGQCQPEEFVLSAFGRGIGIASTSVSYDRTNDVLNPARGWRVRGEQRAGITYSELVSTLRFYRSTIEGATFLRAFKGVLALRVQASGVFAPGADLVDGTPLLPQQERLFAGGQNSVRGFQQNLLGPVVYVVQNVDTMPLPNGDFGVEAKAGAVADRAVPRGGTAMVVGNIEYRRGFRFLAEELQLVTFVDGGSLWETSSHRFSWKDVRYTPGVGIRVVTPLGPFRMDVGYRPYSATAGRALYINPSTTEGDMFYCASPRTDPDADYSDVLSCPATFRPPSGRGFLSKLVFHFGLGHAF